MSREMIAVELPGLIGGFFESDFAEPLCELVGPRAYVEDPALKLVPRFG